MIKKTIDISKLKVKYVLGIHSSLPSYPDSEDILYELIRDYCGRVAKELKFTDISLKKKYGLTDDQLRDTLEWLSNKKIIKTTIDNSAYTTLKVIKNPYE